mgnify:FL=1
MAFIYALLSALLDFVIMYSRGSVNGLRDIWKPLLLLPLIYVGFLLLHLIVFCLYSFTADSKYTDNIHNSYRRLMLSSIRLFLKTAKVRVHTEGTELVPDDGQFLLVCNHLSTFDPIITISALADKNLAFVAKKELFGIFAAGKYMAKSGCIGLDRENNREAVKAINKAADNIKNGVCAMGIYPEGYVNKNPGTLLPFRCGAFKIAKKAKVPIVVSVVSNTRDANKNMFRHHSDVYLRILKIIPYDEIAPLKTSEIGDMVYKMMIDEI